MKKGIFLFLTATFLLIGSMSAYATENYDIIKPIGVYAEEDGSLILTDSFNKSIFKQNSDGTFEKIVGNTTHVNAYNEPQSSYVDSDFANASFVSPWGITPFLNGYAITDSSSHTVRYIDMKTTTVTTAAGEKNISGFSDGVGIEVKFNRPTGITTMKDGSLLISDTGNNIIRKLDVSGTVTTFAGSVEGDNIGSVSQAQFNEPTGIWCDENDVVYVADTGNHRIVKIENGIVSVISGTKIHDDAGTTSTLDDAYLGGFQNGKTSNALFNAPMGIIVDNGTIYVSDTGNSAIRKIENGIVSTIIVGGSSSEELYPVLPMGLALVQDTLRVGDTFAQMLFNVSISDSSLNSDIIFNDITTLDWFAKDVQDLNNLGVYDDMTEFNKTSNSSTGTYNATFSQSSGATRGMFVYALSQYEIGMRPYSIIAGTTNFYDVSSSDYYSNATMWAADLGITTGTSEGIFSPNATLTRAQCVTFLYRYSQLLGISTLATSDFSAFVDGNTVPSWATEAMAWAVQENIITGKPGQLLAPNDILTRAEMSVILNRFGY